MLDDLIRVWTADADILAALPALQAYVAPRCRGELDPDEVDLTYAPRNAGAPEMSILHCYSANAHADLWHPAWTAILVVQSAGHRVGLVDYRPKKGVEACDYAADTPRREIALAPGQIVWLNDHHTHWLTPAADESRFISINLDFENTEEPEAITARFRALLAAHGMLTPPEPEP
jgi:hypothetical protein